MAFAPINSNVASRENRNGVVQSRTVCFSKTVENEVLLMVGVHVDDTITSGEQGICDEFFDQPTQRFPMKNLGKLTIYLVARSSVTGTTESSR